VDHATLHRWLRRGESAHPESRYRRFLEAAIAAEQDPQILVALPHIEDGPSDAELRWAMRFLDRTGWGRQPEELGDGPIES